MDLSKLKSVTRTDRRVDTSGVQTICGLIYIYVCVHPGEFTQLITHESAIVAAAELQASVSPSRSDSTERMRTALVELDRGTSADTATLSHLNSMLADAALAYAVRTNTWRLLKPTGVVHFLLLAQPAATDSYDFRPLILPVVDLVPISATQLAEILSTVTLKLKLFL